MAGCAAFACARAACALARSPKHPCARPSCNDRAEARPGSAGGTAPPCPYISLVASRAWPQQYQGRFANRPYNAPRCCGAARRGAPREPGFLARIHICRDEIRRGHGAAVRSLRPCAVTLGANRRRRWICVDTVCAPVAYAAVPNGLAKREATQRFRQRGGKVSRPWKGHFGFRATNADLAAFSTPVARGARPPLVTFAPALARQGLRCYRRAHARLPSSRHQGSDEPPVRFQRLFCRGTC